MQRTHQREHIEENLETFWLRYEDSKLRTLAADDLPYHNNRILAAMERAELVTRSKEKISLTAKGQEEARQMIRRHRLSERLFSDLFGIEGDTDDRACRLEHIITEGVEDKVCTLLGHPRVCSHGKPIPEGECCRQAREEGVKQVQTLDQLPLGSAARIIYVLTEDAKEINKIISMGVEPGATVVLERRFPSYIFMVGDSRFAVDSQLAKSIFVVPHRTTP